MTAYQKIMLAARIFLSVVIILLAALQLLDVWEGAIDCFIPLMGVFMVAQAASEWEKSRSAAILSLVVAAFIFGAFISVHYIL